MIGNKKEHLCGYRPVQAILGRKFLRLRVIDFAGFRYDSGKRVAMVLAKCDLGRTRECRPCAIKSRRAKGRSALCRTTQRRTKLDDLTPKQRLYFDVLMAGRIFLSEQDRTSAIEDATEMALRERDPDAAIREWIRPWRERETRNRCSLLNELLLSETGRQQQDEI